ncbi:DNA repair and recombination protein RadA [Candidatus Hecatella orcuttiae]|uniref:DNA repair and recombination protein RadA n=1 Tax=Candidatus Hecatella orcuttiae TaxID=1935119 RepID=UPI0028680F2D|nr:DNA repair and recombination protein RadA [Candidatus Hecatella orcuttiae]
MACGQEESGEGKTPQYREIEEIPGVGPATAEKLRKLGYSTIESLATASLKELTQTLGEKTAYTAITEARKCIISIPFMRADEYLKFRSTVERLTTGCKALDELLGGGVESQSITEVYGEYGTGKSQICHQLCVNAQLPKEQGGLDGGVLYIDTENTFRPERIVQIAKHLDLDPDRVLSRIIYAEALTSDHQMHLLDNASAQFKENNIRLIILDSLISHFRSEFIGREMLAERQQKLEKHLHKLIRLARAYNAVAFVTNQVMARPDAFLSEAVGPTGGHILAHTSHTRVFLRKAAAPHVRIARLMVSPSLPEGRECIFKISERGIEDTVLEKRR